MDDRGSDCPPYDPALALGSWAWGIRGYICGRVALQGGDPDKLSLRQFLDVAYVLLVDQYRHLGDQVPLHIARKATDELLESQWDGEAPPPELDGTPTAADNDAALAGLMAQMQGING